MRRSSKLGVCLERFAAWRYSIVVVFAIAYVASLFPIWAPGLLPLLDLPNHLDAIAIWHRYDDASWGYSHFYRLNLLPLPYWGYFFPVHLLSYLLPIEVANKVYFSVYALALPLGAALLAKQMGRSPWLGVFAFSLVFNFNFQFGFITFCAGVTIMLYALFVLDRFLDRPSLAWGATLGILTTFLYTTHVLPWLFFGVAAGALLLCHRLGRRTIVASALMLPSVALGMWAFHAAKDGSTDVQPGPLAYAARKEPALAIAKEAVHRIIATWPGHGAYVVMGLYLVLWLLLMATRRGAATRDEGERSVLFRYRLEIVFALAVAAMFALPTHLYKPVDLWMIGGRFTFVIVLFGALLPRGSITPVRAVLLVAACALHVAYCARLTSAWRAFDGRASAMRHLCELIPRGSSTLTLLPGDDGAGDPAIETQAVPYTQFHAYPQFFAGGYDQWALSTGFPMVRKPFTALPAPRWKMPSTFRFRAHGAYYDYIITQGERADYAYFGPDDAGAAPLVRHEGDWRLYRVAEKKAMPTIPPAAGKPHGGR